jgi:hypothetical protein
LTNAQATAAEGKKELPSEATAALESLSSPRRVPFASTSCSRLAQRVWADAAVMEWIDGRTSMSAAAAVPVRQQGGSTQSMCLPTGVHA